MTSPDAPSRVKNRLPSKAPSGVLISSGSPAMTMSSTRSTPLPVLETEAVTVPPIVMPAGRPTKLTVPVTSTLKSASVPASAWVTSRWKAALDTRTPSWSGTPTKMDTPVASITKSGSEGPGVAFAVILKTPSTTNASTTSIATSPSTLKNSPVGSATREPSTISNEMPSL